MTTAAGTMAGAEFLEHIRERMEQLGMPDEPRVERVSVPGVEIPLHVRTFNAEAYAALLAFGRAHPRDTAGKVARLLAFGMCDATGGLCLTIEQAGRVPHFAALAIARHIIRVNPSDDAGLTDAGRCDDGLSVARQSEGVGG